MECVGSAGTPTECFEVAFRCAADAAGPLQASTTGCNLLLLQLLMCSLSLPHGQSWMNEESSSPQGLPFTGERVLRCAVKCSTCRVGLYLQPARQAGAMSCLTQNVCIYIRPHGVVKVCLLPPSVLHTNGGCCVEQARALRTRARYTQTHT